MKFIWVLLFIAALIVVCHAQGYGMYGNPGRGGSQGNGYGNQGRGGYERGPGGYGNQGYGQGPGEYGRGLDINFG